jgi:hypothetical protein
MSLGAVTAPLPPPHALSSRWPTPSLKFWRYAPINDSVGATKEDRRENGHSQAVALVIRFLDLLLNPMKRATREVVIRKILGLAALGAAIVAVTPASATAAPTGTLTTAEADSAWTTAHIAGSMAEDGKFAGYGPDYPAYLIEWRPVVTVAPSLPAYTCHGDEALDSDPNTKVVYWGATQTAPGAVPFDVPDAAILTGVYGQRACLSEVATVSAQQAVCIVQAPILGQDPHACPFVSNITMRSVAAKTITQAPAPQPTPGPTLTLPPTATPTPPPEPTPTLSLKLGRGEAITQARKALGRRYRSFRRGHARRITAVRTANPARRRCRAAWSYRSRRYRATVTVTKLDTRRYVVKVRRR